MSRYDKIGTHYNRTRSADPQLVATMWKLLGEPSGSKILDVGCGTGNYTIALKKLGGNMHGIDSSATMLKQAMTTDPRIDWQIGEAENVQLEAQSFDGAIASLTLHHWNSLKEGFDNIYSALRPGARFVIFTSTSEQMKHYWLGHYFPQMMQESLQQMPSKMAVTSGLLAAGFTIESEVPYTVHPQLEDHFLYSGKLAPNRYLDPEFRAGISSFQLFCTEEELTSGLKAIEEDLKEGSIYKRIRESEHLEGDYLFIQAIKA